MKLGEALTQRKYLTQQIPHITRKLAESVVVERDAPVQESDDKAPDLKHELDTALRELNRLILAINRTNNQTTIPDSPMTVMEAVARRDFLKLAVAQYQAFFPKIRPRVERDHFDKDAPVTVYVVAEGIDAVAIKSQLNAYAQEYRLIDTQLQSVNWTADLIEA